MTHPPPTGPTGSSGGKIDSIIQLAGCSDRQRILLAGLRRRDPAAAWRSRGYHRVATTATSRLPRGQYDVAVVEWRQHSIKALETMLDWLVYFLSPQGVLVIWIDGAGDTASARRGLRSVIEQVGFQVEAGKRCGNGFAISAYRLNAGRPMLAGLMA